MCSCSLTCVERKVEAGRSVADVGVGRRVNGQQEVADEFEQIHVRRRSQHLLDDLDEGQAHLRRDGGQMLISMLLEEKHEALSGGARVEEKHHNRSVPTETYLQHLAGEQEAMH